MGNRFDRAGKQLVGTDGPLSSALWDSMWSSLRADAVDYKQAQTFLKACCKAAGVHFERERCLEILAV